jgi:diguanylate cyclase (GGDEF)-like protein
LRSQRLHAAIERLRGERNHLKAQASVDTLTGALGRRALSDCVQRSLTAGVPFAVVFADIDHFKRVNDTFGHHVGDIALRRVAATLARGRRAGDVCGRYGGEEFVLVVGGVSAEQALIVAERHRKAITGLRLVDCGGPERLTISMGVAWCDPEIPDASVESLLKRADAALYRAKAAGRDCVQMAESCNSPSVSPMLGACSGARPVTTGE